MAGYIGSKSSVTQVDGYNKTEADAEFLNDPASVITVSGSNVGIGESSPDTSLDVVGGSADSVVDTLTLKNDSTGASAGTGINFVVDGVNGATTAAIYGQRTGYAYHQGSLQFLTRDSIGGGLLERMRLDGDGNMLVGQTTANAAVVGASIRSDGEVVATCSGAASGSFNRLGEGATVDVKKDGVIVGSLASDVMDFLVIGQDETGLGFVHDAVDSGSPRIIPRRVGSAASSNGLVDLGDTGSKFKDIHLGGRIKYHSYNVNTELQRTYNQWATATTSISGSWVYATGSQIAFYPKRPDTTISIFADIKTGQAWSTPSGTNHGQVEWRVKAVCTTGTYTGPVYSDWGRVDSFSGIFEKVNTGASELHIPGAAHEGGTITISIEFRTTRTAGTGLANGGINVWGGLSLYTVEEVLV